MVSSYTNVLSAEDINYLLNMPEVLTAKNNIDNKSSGAVYFSVPLTPSIKSTIYQKMGLDLSNVESIPMRWIKGDTLPHIDRGTSSFENTYLMYLTDSTGELIVDNESYPISQNNAYIFNEGLDHKTINTGLEPRLLLGPMSETAFAVGAATTISAPGGTTVNIRYTDEFGLQYTYDNINWNGFSTPFSVQNTDTDAGFLKIIFTTNITLFTDFSYFVCTTSKIQFGSETLNIDGFRPIITINGVTNYPGLIQNNIGGNGFSNINIFNLDVRSINSTIPNLAGWIGGEAFGTNATNNYIINCSSNGSMSDYCGGIVGSSAAGTGGSLNIIGCSSSGNIIGNCAGGIVGDTGASNGGTITINSCWSTGNISGSDTGGIIGNSAGDNATVTITNCYSTGDISGASAGGICGSDPAIRGGTVNISNCYSNGDIIGNKSGGIVGEVDNTAPRNIGIVAITNCYTTGDTDTDIAAGGITGAFTNNPDVILSHCYTSGLVNADVGYFIGDSNTDVIGTCFSEAYNSYPVSPGWTTSHANTVLTGTPTTIIGTTWVATVTNQPYELFNMGYTPYTLTNISLLPPSLIRDYDVTVPASTSTNDAFNAGLLSKNNITSDGYTIGGTLTKDMDNLLFDDEFTPTDYPDIFPGLAPIIDANIIAGDKLEEDRLRASRWNDWGNDVFDGWGFFYLYDVTSQKYYFPLINPQNQSDGVLTKQTFQAFERTFTITHGYCVQGIFKFDITVNDNLPFRFGAYGNMGSDGDQVETDNTYNYTINDKNLTLYYRCDAESGDNNEIVYSYFIPKKISDNNSKPYNVYYNDGDYMSIFSNEVTKGLIVYFAKKNDVKEWVVNDLNIVSSYSILEKTAGSSSSYNTITINNDTGSISTTINTFQTDYTLYIRNTGSYNITTVNLTVGDPPCLTEDTIVLTPNGYVNVSTLRQGDSVITSDNRIVKIVKIYKSHVIGNNKTYPCIVPKNSIAPNYPSDTFKISQGHLIKYKNSWIYPRLYFPLDKSMNTIKYYHIKLENYITDHLVINNGVVVESLGNHPSDIYNHEYKKESIKRLRYKYNKINSIKKTKNEIKLI